jgi:tetratricopeptide (TPR) repeat protein
MRSADFLKVAVFTALAFVLGGCAQALEGNRARTPENLGAVKPVQEVESIRAGAFAPSASADLKGMSQVLASYEKRLPRDGDARDFTLAELARLCFILGERGDKHASEKNFEKGRYYADLLCQEKPRRVEGHYWLALNLAGLAEVGRASRGLRLVPTIIEHLLAALALDEAYDQAGPHRVLGRVYCEAPSWPLSEGDLSKSVEHLRTAVELAPTNSTNHLYLAETLTQLGKSEDAYWELQQVLTCTTHAISRRSLEEDYQEALGRMKQYEKPEQNAPAEEADVRRANLEGSDHK